MLLLFSTPISPKQYSFVLSITVSIPSQEIKNEGKKEGSILASIIIQLIQFSILQSSSSLFII
jgi:hypothetical protein